MSRFCSSLFTVTEKTRRLSLCQDFPVSFSSFQGSSVFFLVLFIRSLIKGLTNQAVMDALNLGQGVCEPSSLSCENEDIFVKRGHFSRALLLLRGGRRYGTNNVRAAGVCLCVCVCGQAARCCQPLETMSLTHFKAVNAATWSRREALVPSGSPPS